MLHHFDLSHQFDRMPNGGGRETYTRWLQVRLEGGAYCAPTIFLISAALRRVMRCHE